MGSGNQSIQFLFHVSNNCPTTKLYDTHMQYHIPHANYKYLNRSIICSKGKLEIEKEREIGGERDREGVGRG